MGLLAEVSVAFSHFSKDTPARWGLSKHEDMRYDPLHRRPCSWDQGKLSIKTPLPGCSVSTFFSQIRIPKAQRTSRHPHTFNFHTHTLTHLPLTQTHFLTNPLQLPNQQNAFSSHHRLRNLLNGFKSVPLPSPPILPNPPPLTTSPSTAVLANPLNAPGVADAATTDATASPYIWHCDTDGVCSYLEKQNGDVVKRAEEFAKREKALMKREEDLQKREAAIVEREDAVKRNVTIVERQDCLCPGCCCSNCDSEWPC